MKLFKRIYYPVLAALLIVVIALGFADASRGGGGSKTFANDWETVKGHIDVVAAQSHNSHNSDAMETVRDYIGRTLYNSGFFFADGEENDEGDYEVNFRTSSRVPQPSYTVQESTLTPETVASIESLESGTYVVSKTVHNIVAVIPGSDTVKAVAEGTTDYGDTVMLMAHYDSRPEGAGASDNAVSVASMLGVIGNIMEERTAAKKNGAEVELYKNDLVFVFTDAEEEHMYGAYAFKYQFKGFYDIYSRVRLGANFDNLGNKGTLVMFQTSDKNSALIGKYASINGGAFTSSIADFVYGAMDNFTDYEIYDGITSLDFANVGGTYLYHTYDDKAENVVKTAVEQQYSMMQRYIDAFASENLSSLESKTDSVYFSYLDMGVGRYPVYVGYILGGIVLALAAAAITVNILKRRKHGNKAGFSFGKMGEGAAVQLLTMAATLAVLFVAYFLIALLLVGFGVITIHSIGSLRYASVGLVISAMLLTLAVSFAFYGLFKKLFSVKSADVARGTAFLWGLIAAVLSFALPQVAYFFAISAIGVLAVVLAGTLFKEKFREKTGDSFDKLFLYIVPFIFTLPMIIPVIMIAATVLGCVYLPVIMMLFMLVAGFIAPYFTQLQPVLDRVAGKLPQRKIRVERVVTEMVEDRAKKGKFTEQTVKKVTKEPTPWRYKNYMGVTFIAVLSVIMIILFSSFGVGFSSAVAGGESYRNAVYNDSLVYVWEKTGTANAVRTVEVHDTIAYKYMYRAMDGFKWDSTKGAYVKTDSAQSVVTVGQEPTISKSDDGLTYRFKPYDASAGEITLKISGAAAITSLKFDNGIGDPYEVVNDGNSVLNVQLPYGYGEFTMEVDTTATLNIEYVEICPNHHNINNLDEWVEVKKFIDSVYEEYSDNLRSGIVLKYTLSL